MPAPNQQRFNRQVLRAVAFIYAAHPAKVDIDHNTISPENERYQVPSDDEFCDSKHGTLVWLHRNGVIDGHLLESSPLNGGKKAAIVSAQLGPQALRILNGKDKNLTEPLGDEAIAAIGGRQEQVVADRLVQRLLEG